MSREVKVSEEVVDQFPVFDLDGYTKKSGETSFTKTIWQNGSVRSDIPVTISEIGSSPGEYKVSWTPDSVGFWMVEVDINYNKDVWVGDYDVVSAEAEDLESMIRRILGLGHENIFIDNTIYDSNAQLVSARTRIFDTKAHCDAATDGGSEIEGLIASYLLTTQWDVLNEFKIFKQTRET